MNLAATRVKELQFFLMDAAKRYVASSSPGSKGAGELLSSAAALDYVLLVSSERPGDLVDDGAIAAGIRETMLRAANTALDFIDRMLEAPDDIFGDFIERHVRVGGIFETFGALRSGGVLRSSDVAFRIVTAASDLLDRRRG